MKKLVICFILLLGGCYSIKEDYPLVSDPIKISQLSQGDLDNTLKETAVVLLGEPQSDWVQYLMPILNDVMNTTEIKGYYFNIYSDRENNTEYYQKLHSKVLNSLDKNSLEYTKMDKLYVPTILFVKNGDIETIHLGTVTGHALSAGEVPNLTKTEKDELYNILKSKLKLIE